MEDRETAKFLPGADPLVQTTIFTRKLRMQLLLKQEIDRLVDGYSSPSLGLLGLFLGAFVSLVTTVLTAGIIEPAKRYFVDATWGTGAPALVFAVFAIRDWLGAREILSDLESERGVDVDVSVQTKSGAIERKG